MSFDVDRQLSSMALYQLAASKAKHYGSLLECGPCTA